MRYCRFVFGDVLMHHGVKGQKWGVRNGPPYPLNRKRGKRVDRFDTSEYNKRNRAAVDSALKLCGNYPIDNSETAELSQQGKDKLNTVLANETSNKVLRRLAEPESLEQSLRFANPLFGSTKGYNNCTYSAIAGFLRQKGYDVVAKDTAGESKNLPIICEDCFVFPKILEGRAVKFGKSKNDASEFLVKRFGENASGCCAVEWVGNNGGHTFSWMIKNGKVTFVDYQQHSDNVDRYWRLIDPDGFLQLVRLDNADINMNNIFNYVDNRRV